jgi:hypothetical protein
MMIGVPNPIVGDAASHVTDTDLPPQAHVVVINDNNGNPVLYDLACPKAKANAYANTTALRYRVDLQRRI